MNGIKLLLKPMNQAVLMKRNMQICKKAGNGIVSDALEERNALMQQFGWSSGEESSSQSSTQKGFAAMSQDTGDELNGRLLLADI